MAAMDASPPASSAGPNLKRIGLFSLLFIGLSAAGLYTIYSQLAERSFSLDPRIFSWPVLVGVALLLPVYFVADGLRLHYTLRALGQKLPMRHVMRLVFINFFFSNATPLATGGGFAQIWYLGRKGIPVGVAMAATTIRTILAITMIFAATPIFLIGLNVIKGDLVGTRAASYLAGFAALYLVAFGIALFRTRWTLIPVNWALKGMRALHLISEHRCRRWGMKSKREMLLFARSFAGYVKGPKRFIALSVFFTFLFFLSMFSFPAVLVWGLGYEIGYLTVIGLLVVVTFVMYFSPTPGGSGIAEGVFGHLFAGLLTGNHLVLVTVVWRFLTMYLGMILGVLVTQLELSGR